MFTSVKDSFSVMDSPANKTERTGVGEVGRLVYSTSIGVENSFVYTDGNSLGIGTDSLSKTLNVHGTALLTRAGAAFLEFKRTDGFAGESKVSVGMLGGTEANLSFNMNYEDDVHRYYDPSKNATWLALGSFGWQIQFAPTGYAPDMWTNSGKRLLLYQGEDGNLVVDTNADEILGGGWSAKLSVSRSSNNPSISGKTDLIIEGAKTKGTSGIVYINEYNSGNVILARGGGKVGIGKVPTATLDINGQTYASAILNSGIGYNSYYGASVNDVVYSYFGVAGFPNGFVQGSALGDSVIRTEGKKVIFSTDSGVTPNMVVSDNGFIGLGGIISPLSPLDVKGDNSIIRLRKKTNSNGSLYIDFLDFASTSLGFIGYGSSTFDFYIANLADGNMVFHNDGSAKITIMKNTGEVYIENTCSASAFIDRTPFFSGDALSAIKNIRGRNGQIDHYTLPDFARTTIAQKSGEVKEGRDLGAMVSIMTTAIQQLLLKIEKLEGIKK